MSEPMLSDQAATLMTELPDCEVHRERPALRRQLVFADFSQAWGSMSRIARLAESRNHHPEWTRIYNRVNIPLHPHDFGGPSWLDVQRACVIERIAAQVATTGSEFPAPGRSPSRA